MKIVQTHKRRSIFRVILAALVIFCVVSQFGYFDVLRVIMGCCLLVSAVCTIIGAFRDYREVWEVTKAGDRYSIFKDGKPLFAGPVTTLLAITDDSKSYLIYPLKGRRIVFPKVDDNGFMSRFYQEYREKNVAEQVAASDR